MNPNIIIAVILIAILIPAIKSTYDRMAGKKTCCGSKEQVPKKKIKGQKLYDVAINIEGMHCDNCKNRITKKLNEMDGVVCNVSLPRKRAVVSLYKDVEWDALKRAIEQLDFTVTNMEKM